LGNGESIHRVVGGFVRNIGGGIQIVGVSVLGVSGKSRVSFSVNERRSVKISSGGRLNRVGSLGSVVFSFGFNFNESHVVFAVAACGVLFGFLEKHGVSKRGSVSVTFAAFNLGSASGVFTNQFTFRFGAFGFVAFPVTSGFFTNSFTFGFRDLAVSNTVRRFADSDTFRAVFSFTGFFGAHDLAVRSFALNVTNSVSGFLAGRVALGGFANGSANCVASGVVAFPGAFRVALLGKHGR